MLRDMHLVLNIPIIFEIYWNIKMADTDSQETKMNVDLIDLKIVNFLKVIRRICD